jgi:ankyrin repeat protein
VNQLIDAGVDISCKDKQGVTPLHEACSNGHVDIANKLIESGADIHVQNNDGEIPCQIFITKEEVKESFFSKLFSCF